MLVIILHGVALAFGLIIPFGAQNIFIFNQGATQRKFIAAFPAVITASICDTLLILAAVWGISVIVLSIPVLQYAFFFIGLFFLLYMGYVIWNGTTNRGSHYPVAMKPKRQILFAITISLFNPHAILDTIGVMGTSSLSYSGTERGIFTFSAIMVSWCWFFGVAFLGKIIGDIDEDGMFIRLINKISALILWSVAIFLMYQFFK